MELPTLPEWNNNFDNEALKKGMDAVSQEKEYKEKFKDKKSDWQYLFNLLFGVGGVLLGAWLSRTDNTATEQLLKRQVVLLEQISAKLIKDTVVKYQTHTNPDTSRYK